MRHQVTWQYLNVSGQDTTGEDVGTWTDFVTCRAQILALNGLELERAQQMWAEARYSLIQLYVPGLTAKMRVSWFIDRTVRILNVLNINDPPGIGRYLEVITKDYE